MVVTAADLAEIAPMVAVTEDEAMGWEPQSGYADPYLVTSSYANAARTLAQRSTSVFRPLASKSWTGRVQAVNTLQGSIETPAVVVATGPWSKGELVKVGVDVPLVTVRHQVASLARPVDRLPQHPAVGDIAQSFSFRPDGPRMTLMGFGDDEEADVETYNQLSGLDDMALAKEKLVTRIPAMSDAYFRGGWAGLFTTTPDWHPILDRAPGVDGLYCAVGFSGHGFKLSPMIGLTMAELVAQGEATSIDISPCASAALTRVTSSSPAIATGCSPRAVGREPIVRVR